MMGGGAGHMQDMVNRIKELKSRRAERKESKDRYRSLQGGFSDTELNFKKVSKEELEKINTRNREIAKQERRKKNIVTILIFVPVFLLAMYYLKQSLFMTLK
ncbi:hypothetical protein [Wenyingzhuangia sp. IMCC45574]